MAKTLNSYIKYLLSEHKPLAKLVHTLFYHLSRQRIDSLTHFIFSLFNDYYEKNKKYTNELSQQLAESMNMTFLDTSKIIR